MARSDSPIRGFVMEAVASECITSVRVLSTVTMPVAIKVAVLPIRACTLFFTTSTATDAANSKSFETSSPLGMLSWSFCSIG